MRPLRYSQWPRCAALTAIACTLLCNDPAKAITFDPEAPFTLDLGRGTRTHGLDTVSVAENGQVTFVRAARSGHWETSTMQLTPEQLRDIAALMKRDGVLRLAKGYRKPNPGSTQWILMIRQGDAEKISTFEDEFPAVIRKFAADLDQYLERAGARKIAWQPSTIPHHDRPLWSAIKPANAREEDREKAEREAEEEAERKADEEKPREVPIPGMHEGGSMHPYTPAPGKTMQDLSK